MNFLEKDLETIIWENYEACEERGLTINASAYRFGRRYRQMNLHPFGIADLVNIVYSPAEHICWVQVIECKRGKVDADTYLQAKRYATALQEIIRGFALVNWVEVRTSIVLVGSAIDPSGPLAHVVAQDNACQSFVYKYELDGIKFYDFSIHWWASATQGGHEGPADMQNIEGYILDQMFDEHQFQREHGDPTQALLITPNGVLVNPNFPG